METKNKQEENKPSVEFSNCKNCGQEIKALVNYFTGTMLGNYTLERALEEVQKNGKKIEEYKLKLLK